MPEQQNNGQKTEEQLKAERLERYKADPDSFIEVKPEVILCVIRTPEGPMSLVSGSKQEIQIAYAKMNQRVMNTLNSIEMAEMQKKIRIAKPGFLNKLRGMK